MRITRIDTSAQVLKPCTSRQPLVQDVFFWWPSGRDTTRGCVPGRKFSASIGACPPSPADATPNGQIAGIFTTRRSRRDDRAASWQPLSHRPRAVGGKELRHVADVAAHVGWLSDNIIAGSRRPGRRREQRCQHFDRSGRKFRPD